MRKLTTFFLTLLLSLVVSNAFAAETDITTKLTNPSFENDDVSGITADSRGGFPVTGVTGWTVTGEPAVLDLMTEDATATDNDFGAPGAPSAGNYMLYVRNSWATLETSVLQSVTLPAGSYKVTVDTKCVTTTSTAKLVAGSEEVALTLNSTMPTDWDTAELTFSLTAETEVSLGVVISFEGANGSFLIDNFQLYQVMPVDDGDYLVVNAVTGNYLAGGQTYGTQAVEGGRPQFFTFELQTDGTYTLDSHQSNGGTNHFLGTNLYVDSGAAEWIIAEVDGGITLYNATAGGYLTGNGFQKALTGEATAGATAVWTLVTKDEILASMADATEDNPVDVSALIPACEPKRNAWGDSWTATGYNVTAVPTNYAFGSGSSVASVCESYHSSNGFDIRQTVPTLPAGKYTLTAQAFYRIDTANSDTPVMYAGDMTNCVELPSFASDATGVPNSMVTAYSAFLDGDYPVSLDFTVADDDTNVTVGFTSAAANSEQWTIFGELGLLYLGEVETEPYEFVCTDWGSMDTGRVTDDKITYNEVDNTITVNAGTGDNNVALSNGRDPYTTANMYITDKQIYLTVIGSDLSTATNASQLWWMNGNNNSGMTATPDVTVTLTDGQILFAWEISTLVTADAEGKIMLTGWTGFGLTSTTGTSVISDINFYTEDELNDITKGELVYVTVYSCEAEPVSAEDNTPAHWTASPALDNANFHINTWSTEADESGMVTPFVEYWVGQGNGLADEFISHNAISGLEAGTYKVSIDARAYDEGSLAEAGQGISFNVNGTDVALSTGTQSVYEEKSALVYGTYTIEDIESTDGNLSIRFVVASQENCDWLSWKNLKVEQRVNTRDITLVAAVGKMNDKVAEAQEAAITAFESTRTAADYYTAVEAIEAAEASVAFYAELTALIEKYADKLDETGAAFWEQTQGYIGYEGDGENGYLNEEDIDLFMASLIAAQSVQTTDNTDWSLVMKYTGTWEAPYSNSGTFGIYADGVESYAGTNYTAAEGQILYKTVEDLLPGTYEVTFYAAANSCHLGDDGISGDDIAQVFANDAVVDVTVGTLSAISDMSVYEVTLTAIVGEDGILVFGIQNIATGGNWYVAQEVSLKLVDFATETVEDDDYDIDDEVVIGDDTYKILSENLFVNGGFNEKASYGIVPGWTAGNTYTDQLLAENVTIETTGGYNNRGYLTLPESVGASSEHTPTQAIAVNVGSTYLFVGYTSGTEPTDANKRYSALFAMDSATEEAHIIESGTSYGQDIITLEWGNPDNWGDGTSTTGWTRTIGTFTATTDYVGMRMNWSLGSYDGFQLYEVESPQVVPGDYLVMNAETGNYLAGGLAWGTQAMEGGKPQFIGFEQVADGLYVLDSHQSNGGDNHYIGVVVNEDESEDVYFDTAGATWMVLKDVTTGTINIGKVVLDKDGAPDMTAAIGWVKTRGFQNAIELVSGRENATDWTLVKKSEIIESMAAATATAPVDVTALIPAAEPKRNAWGASWTMTAYDGESAINNGTLGQDWNVASVAESWHSENGFLFTQIVPELPVGSYKLTAQAFYRNDIADDAELVAPVMYAGDEAAELPLLPTELTDEQIAAGMTIPANMVDAYQAFLLEEYPVSVEFTVAEEGDVEIGFSSELATDNQLWTIFGELSLYYLGNDVTVEPEPTPEPEPEPEPVIVHECVAELSHWTTDGTTGIALNTWSVEDDASGMIQPFLQLWVWGLDTTQPSLEAATVSHEQLTDLEPGTYEVSLDIRIYSEVGNEIGEGTTFNANGVSADLLLEGNEATNSTNDYPSETLVYGTYVLTCTVGEAGTLDISINIPEGVEYNWIAWKNLTVTYIGEAEPEPEPEPTYTLVHECEAELSHWTTDGTTGIGLNTWSVEADASGMVVPFLQLWVWSGDATQPSLEAATISHETLTDLQSGTYTVVLDARIFSEAGNEIGEGTTLSANGVSVDLLTEGSTGTYATNDYPNMTEVYGTYTITCEVGEDGTLDISINIPEGVEYNWIAWKNLKVYYHGEIEPEPEGTYAFVATEWGSIDLGRVTDENVIYDEASNTITVNAGTGANNVALSNGRTAPYTTAEYTITEDQIYFTVIATNISTESSASQLWWMNGYNEGMTADPVKIEVFVDEDGNENGVVLVAWDISDYVTVGEDGLITLDGWTGFGLTSTTGTSVISDINFYTKDELDDVVTAIGSVKADNEPAAVEGIYTLSGVRISKITKSGIYIVDGKKVLVK